MATVRFSKDPVALVLAPGPERDTGSHSRLFKLH